MSLSVEELKVLMDERDKVVKTKISEIEQEQKKNFENNRKWQIKHEDEHKINDKETTTILAEMNMSIKYIIEDREKEKEDRKEKKEDIEKKKKNIKERKRWQISIIISSIISVIAIISSILIAIF